MDDPLAEKRRLALEAFRAALGTEYPACWTISKGDFSGRDVAVDVFNVPSSMKRDLLRRLRQARDTARGLLGSECIFIFHTPEATKEHYQGIVAELTKS